jgi:hypothetical protein
MTYDRYPPIQRNPIIQRPTRRDQPTPSQRNLQRGQPIQRSEPFHPPINPKKWYLDENTGEYLRVKHRERDRVLLDPTPYNDRWKESVLAGQELLKLAGWTFGLLTGGVVLWAIAENTQKPDCILPGSWAIICFLSSIGPFFHLVVGLAKEGFRDLGPEPVSQRPRREQAQQQQVHGDGRFMKRDEIHRAASGETAFPGGEQQYED